MSRKAFTVEEANGLIPRLEEVVGELHGLRQELDKHHEQLQLLDALWGAQLREERNPDRKEFVQHKAAVRETIRRIEETIREEVMALGVRFPVGGLEHGLLDFPTTYEGRWVYLCWKLGEPSIREWHEVDGGFRGRRPLTEEQERVMGRVDDPDDVDDSALDF